MTPRQLAAVQNPDGEGVLVHLRGLVTLGADLGPAALVDRRERDVALDLGVHLGEVDPSRLGQGELEQRCAALDVHPTAPLAGAGPSLASGDILALEETVSAQFPEALSVIHAEGMKPERRALRIRVRDLSHEYSGDTLRLRFALSSGSFATTVLREIIAGAATGE